MSTIVNTARIRLSTAVVAAAAAVFVVAAPTAEAAPTRPHPTTPLSGTAWKLQASGYARTAPRMYTGSPAYFTIRNNSLSGNDGCNATGGMAVVHGSSVTFGHMISTMRACFAPGAEAIFRQAFTGTRSTRIVGDKLRLNDGPRGYWVFVAQPRR